MRILLLLALLLPAAARADESTPLLYTRAQATIVRSHVAASSLPWQPASDSNPSLTLDIEVRDGTTFYNQKGWFSLSSPDDNHAILLAFAAPGLPPLAPVSDYAKLDILMIDKEGKIVQIAPNLVLADLAQDIYPGSPILAFLILKGGACATLFINPGDVVEYPLFKKPPTVLSAPAEKH